MFDTYYMDKRGHVYPNQVHVDDVRVVVISPEDREQVERLARALPVAWELFEDGADHDEDGRNEDSVDEVQAALREFANPTPPKPDEPTGLGAVVEDSNGDKWVRMAPRIADFDWFNADDHTRSRAYRNIAAVKVLSDGVQP